MNRRDATRAPIPGPGELPSVTYTAVLTRDAHGAVTGQVVELPEAISAGTTLEDALEHLADAASLALATRLESGERLPAIGRTVVAALVVERPDVEPPAARTS